MLRFSGGEEKSAVTGDVAILKAQSKVPVCGVYVLLVVILCECKRVQSVAVVVECAGELQR